MHTCEASPWTAEVVAGLAVTSRLGEARLAG